MKTKLLVSLIFVLISVSAFSIYLKNGNILNKDTLNISDLKFKDKTVNTDPYIGSNTEFNAFPFTNTGYTRFVINLPKQDNEQNYQLKLIVGNNETGDCNATSLMGDFTRKTADGWGYDYYEFNTSGGRISTLMGCPNSSRKTDFVYTTSDFMRYNSLIPVVVFVPIGYELRYEFWLKHDQVFSAQKDKK